MWLLFHQCIGADSIMINYVEVKQWRFFFEKLYYHLWFSVRIMLPNNFMQIIVYLHLLNNSEVS